MFFAAEDGQQEFAALMKSLGVEKVSLVDTSSTQQTKSLEECMNFYNAFLDEVLMPTDPEDAEALDPQRVSLDYLVSWISQVSHSSAFSGIGAPETALLGLHRAIQSRAGKEERVWKRACQIQTVNCRAQESYIYIDIDSKLSY